MSVVHGSETSSTSDILTRWAEIILGQWTNVSPAGTGTLTARLSAQKAFIQGIFQLSNSSVPSSVWTVALDPASGLLKQTQVNSDNSKSIATISNPSQDKWFMETAYTSAAGERAETNTTICTVEDAGNTLNHQVTKRMDKGQALPDLNLVLTRLMVPLIASRSHAASTIPSTSVLKTWGNATVGEWSCSAPTGSMWAAWNSQGTGLYGSFALDGLPSGTWTANIDRSTGQLVQDQIDSDGSTARITIASLSDTQFAMETICADPQTGEIESSNTFETYINGGNTINHQMTNLVKNGGHLPGATIVFNRIPGTS